MLRCNHEDGRIRNILIDCGKSFYESSTQWYATYGLRTLDAVILTHDHADAVMGLDDLRQWTLGGIIQSHVDIYLSQRTMNVVSSVFPYLVDTSKASGGGDVAGLKFHVIPQLDATHFSSFQVEGLDVVPISGQSRTHAEW